MWKKVRMYVCMLEGKWLGRRIRETMDCNNQGISLSRAAMHLLAASFKLSLISTNRDAHARILKKCRTK